MFDLLFYILWWCLLVTNQRSSWVCPNDKVVIQNVFPTWLVRPGKTLKGRLSSLLVLAGPCQFCISKKASILYACVSLLSTHWLSTFQRLQLEWIILCGGDRRDWELFVITTKTGDKNVNRTRTRCYRLRFFWVINQA